MKVLMIAFHFPPQFGSSGLQRTLRFVQQLPECGWHPSVLTGHQALYPETSEDLLSEIPKSVIIRRAFGLDAARHLAVAGKYFGVTSVPDRWSSWRFDGIRQGLKIVKLQKPSVIWSTFPIPTAHVIAMSIARRTGLPWVADFRDPMLHSGLAIESRTAKSWRRIEEAVVDCAAACVFTTPGARRMYSERFPIHSKKFRVIENGFDESSFSSIDFGPIDSIGAQRDFVLLHSGVIYPRERNPSALFLALSEMRKDGEFHGRSLRIAFRAPGHADKVMALAQAHEVDDLVEIRPPVSYQEALREMVTADALLVIQGRHYRDQIPAKLYEYFRAGRPILGLMPDDGDAGVKIRAWAGPAWLAPEDDAVRIRVQLQSMLSYRSTDPVPLDLSAKAQPYSRRARASELAALLSEVAGSSSQV